MRKFRILASRMTAIILAAVMVVCSAPMTAYAEEADKTDEIEFGDTLDINFEKGIIKNLSKNKEYKINVFPEFIKKIIDASGLMSYAKEIVR